MKPDAQEKNPNPADASMFDAPPTEKQAVAVREPASASQVAQFGGDFLAMIERLAVNPAADPAKLGPILDFQERILNRNARDAFDAAMIEMQPNLPEITKDGRIIVKEKTATGRRDGEETQNTPYAKWEVMMPLIKPILYEHGFALRHRIGTAPDGRVRVTAILIGHGHTDDSCYFDLGADTTGSKNNAQAWASSVSYAKRHTASAVLNIVTKGEDDDGRASGRPIVLGDPLTPEELAQVVDLAGAAMCPAPRLIEHMNKKRPKNHPEIDDLAKLPRNRFDEVVAAIRSYEANAAERTKTAAAKEKKA